MSKDNPFPNFVIYVSTGNNSYSTEIVPSKVEEVKTHQKPVIHTPQEEQHYQNSSYAKTELPLSKPYIKPLYENPYHVVNELEGIHGAKIKGIKRNVFEYIAKYNLKGQFPTQKDILKYLKITDENLKRIMRISCNEGLVCTHPKKIGNEYQYVLSNMQDIIKVKDIPKEKDMVKEEELLFENSFEIFFQKVLSNKPNPEFHHINLESNLLDNSDYYRLNWFVKSKNNKAKIFEKKISRHRSCKIMIYPNGKVIMMISTSKEPFEWYSREGWISFIAICGEIHQEIKNALGHNKPLNSDIYDWRITQVDIGYDVPLSFSKASFSFIMPFNICVKVKILDRVFQVYSKRLPTKGSCLRIEEQCSFSSSPYESTKKYEYHKIMMTIAEFKKRFHPTPIKDIINTVIPIEPNVNSSIY
jgi:hypothetical protein